MSGACWSGSSRRDARCSALLVDRMTFTPVVTAGTRGYRFAGHGSYGGLLTGMTWPTTSGGPNGIRILR